MEVYRIYHVVTAKIKPGKIMDEAAKWWREKGQESYESMPGVKSVRAYAAQWFLGGEYGLEFWMEMENYAALDRIDEDWFANPQKYAAWGEALELFEWGPGRLMGDWPESYWSPPEE